MRAHLFHEFGDIGNLQLEEAPEPVAAPGEAIVQVAYAALNPADRYMVAGKYPRPAPRPFAVGRDCSGVVVQAAPDGRFAEGDRVVLLRSDVGVSRMGALAERVAIPEESLAPLPEGWNMEEGAAGPLVHLTAWQALVVEGALQPGQTVLITGSSGGVGSAAIVQAKALGAQVVAMSRGEEKRAWLKKLGADVVVGADPSTFAQEIKEALGGGRVDLVVENLGGPWLDLAVQACGVGGKVVVIGLLAGIKAEVTIGLLIFKQVTIKGTNVGVPTAAESQEHWKQIVQLLNDAGQRPLVDSVFAFEEVQPAFARLAEGPRGKVVVRVSG